MRELDPKIVQATHKAIVEGDHAFFEKAELQLNSPILQHLFYNTVSDYRRDELGITLAANINRALIDRVLNTEAFRKYVLEDHNLVYVLTAGAKLEPTPENLEVLGLVLSKISGIAKGAETEKEILDRVQYSFREYIEHANLETFRAYADQLLPEQCGASIAHTGCQSFIKRAEKIAILFEKTTDQAQKNEALKIVAIQGMADSFIQLFGLVTDDGARNVAVSNLSRVYEVTLQQDEATVLEKFKGVKDDFKFEDRTLLTLAQRAVSDGRIGLLREVLHVMKGQNPNLVSVDDGTNSTLLISACKYQYKTRNNFGETADQIAKTGQRKAEQMALMLYNFGARVEPDAMYQHPVDILKQRGSGNSVVAQYSQGHLDNDVLVGRLDDLKERFRQLGVPEELLASVAAKALITEPQPNALRLAAGGRST